ncbi:WAX2 C-terminal domain, partial [Musa troglodytarum]
MSVCCGCWRSPSLLRGSIARLPLVIVRLVAYRLHNYKAADGSRGSGEPSVFVRNGSSEIRPHDPYAVHGLRSIP